MDRARLKEIFIEEASDIIEKLDIEVIDFEEHPEDKGLLNELFRGVHTLKGSANSFGFKRLGEFVHGFEDVLDYHRNSDDPPSPQMIDLFLRSVDVIKEIFEYEMNDKEGLPSEYEACIRAFKNPSDSAQEVKEEKLADLALEFGDCALDSPLPIKSEESSQESPDSPPNSQSASISAILANVDKSDKKSIEDALLVAIPTGLRLYCITLKLEEDIYLRGQDYFTFFALLAREGRILYSQWDMSDVPKLDALDAESSCIKEVCIYLESASELPEISELFCFLEEHEFALKELTRSLEVGDSSKCNQIPSQIPALEDEYAPFCADNSSISSKIPKSAEDSISEESYGESHTLIHSETPQKEAQKLENQENKHSFVRIDTIKLDELFDSVGELVIAQNFLAEDEAIKTLKGGQLRKTIESLSKITRLIQKRVMSLRMVPIRDTFERMRRVVRDTSKTLGKEIKLQLHGEETEIDKNMVDALSDPLIHIIRNAIDHGIEDDPKLRIAQGKPEIGTVELRAYHKGGNIVVEISDDGRGISRERVYQKALERGLIEPSEELSDTQVYSLILQAGFSTAQKVSDISGRGVGLDVVRSSIETLRGRIEIDSTQGQGSRFSIFLPLTLAIIDGMLVRSAGETFIIPTLSIIESFRPLSEILHVVQGEGEFVDLRQELLPIVRLNEILQISKESPRADESILVCVESEDGKFAILVDELLGRQQVVIKPLGKLFSHLVEFSGGAVLGNGEVALIVNVEGLR
ncbi:MAG: chemotaxis protein CheA [Wolinella sp.]